MIGDIIGGIGKVVGAGIDYFTAKDNRDAAAEQAERNRQMQIQFAKEGIRWKVEDAKQAGVHPLYALGASTTSYAPVSIGSTSSPSMASALGSMGQDVGRAINATQTAPERMSAYAEQASKLQLDNMALQNQLLASRVRTLNQAGGTPPGPDILDPAPNIPRENKWDERPRLSLGNGEIATDPSVANANKFEDRYGDEASIVFAPAIMYRDLVRNYGEPATWPKQAMGSLWQRLSSEAKEEYGNFQNFVSKIRRSQPETGGGW